MRPNEMCMLNPQPELREKLQITKEQVLKLETAAYGLRHET